MLLHDIAKLVNGTLYGDGSLFLDTVASLNESTKNDISFLISSSHKKNVHTSKASAIVSYCKLDINKPYILVEQPEKALSILLQRLYPKKNYFSFDTNSKGSSTSYIDKSATIGTNTFIGKNSSVGKNTSISVNCSIGQDCTIGDNCIIYPNVVIYDNVSIGNNVIIHAGVVIGSDGFGYYQENKEHKKIPQVAKVIIEDDVEIGSNSTIDRGCLKNTVIGKGSKLDNLVQVAHNVTMGKSCILASQSGIMGSGSLGNNVIVGGQVGVGSVSLEDDIIVGGKSGVTKSFNQKGVVISGFPARLHKECLRRSARLEKLLSKGVKK